MMTLEQFLDKYDTYKDRFTLIISETGQIRLMKDDNPYCPITAVCFMETGCSICFQQAHQAAALIGLDLQSTRSIIAAADKHSFFSRQLQRRIG